MALTELQHELLTALLDSGVSKATLIQVLTMPEHSNSISRDYSYIGNGDVAFGTFHQLDSTYPTNNDAIDLITDANVTDIVKVLKDRGPLAAVERLLSSDPYKVAKMIKTFMQQHSVSQREVVESTSLNQSHLSQHLNRGTAMKTRKRSALYLWYVKRIMLLQRHESDIEDDTTVNLTIDDLPSSPPSPKRQRRSRFKWGSASKRILYDSYANNTNPSKEERDMLVDACNHAECVQRGLLPNHESALGSSLVTEVRVYNWFANRRKEDTFKIKYRNNPTSLNPSMESTHLDNNTTDGSTLLECNGGSAFTQQLQGLTGSPTGTSCALSMSRIPPRGRNLVSMSIPEQNLATSDFMQVSQNNTKRNDTDIQPNSSNMQQVMLPGISHFRLNIRKNDLSINQTEGSEAIITASNLATAINNRQLNTLSGIKSQVNNEQLRQGCLPEESQPLFETSNNPSLPVLSQSQMPHLNSISH